jgi:LptD protein
LAWARSFGNVESIGPSVVRRSLGWGLTLWLVSTIFGVGALSGQVPVRDSLRADSLRALADSLRALGDSAAADSLLIPLDTAVASQLGLPSAPSRSFPEADSVIRALQERSGFGWTRYAADSLTFYAQTNRIDLVGSTLLEREGMTLEADTVVFLQPQCALSAAGEPHVFEGGTVLIGDVMSYDTCKRRGLVRAALTNFQQSGVEWYLRGGLGIDSAATRLYAGGGDITSCDLGEPHYHFNAGKVKWVSNNVMVARPARLYVRDVPVLWLPFLFQDMRQGRRSGLLTPRFGLSDLIRPTESFQRQITNMGFYFAINDYVDAQFSVDWFAGTSTTLNGEFRYRWLNRFMSGGLAVSRIYETQEVGAGRSTQISWTHQQTFNQRTRLMAQAQYATTASVVQNNSVNPYLQTATLQSTLNFSKQTDWGTLNFGGRASQDLSNDAISVSFPQFSLTPVPISIGSAVTWSPTFSVSTDWRLHQRGGTIAVPPVGGVPQVDSLFNENRVANIAVSTPLRLGRWNWINNITVADVLSKQRSVRMVPDTTNPDSSVSQVLAEQFSTEINWNTGINLPLLFPGTWKLQPSVGIQNSTSGPFMLRNENTGGRFVQQGKRLSFSLTSSPAFFGFFPGFGPLERIRHSVNPQLRWNYAPAAQVPLEYAQARNPGATPQLNSPALHSVSFGLSQTFEGKFKPTGADSGNANPENARKLKILSIQTSSIEYDFEQAKEPGKNGWRTPAISNSFTSDLLRGFSLRIAHDLWDGPVGDDTTRFSPFLRTVSARFTLSGRAIARVLGLVSGTGGGGEPLGPEEAFAGDTLSAVQRVGAVPIRGTSFPGVENMASQAVRGSGFTTSFNYDLQRQRVPEGAVEDPNRPTTNQTLGMTMSFSPTENWGLSWNTVYNFTTKEFGQQVLRFERDLHRWQATFAVVRAPNGNFAFSFFINLLDQPEIKFNYDQKTVN